MEGPQVDVKDESPNAEENKQGSSDQPDITPSIKQSAPGHHVEFFKSSSEP